MVTFIELIGSFFVGCLIVFALITMIFGATEIIFDIQDGDIPAKNLLYFIPFGLFIGVGIFLFNFCV